MKVFLAGLLDEMYLEDVSEQQAKDHPSTYFKTFKAAKEEMITVTYTLSYGVAPHLIVQTFTGGRIK